MQPNKKTKRKAKRLFQTCLVDGALDDDRARAAAHEVATGGARNRLGILTHFLRLVKLEVALRAAIVESATELPPGVQTEIATALSRRYGRTLTATFVERPDLIGGVRMQVGCNVYDGSVRARLATLEKRF
jgi:F-type H+-transporting ATPase subunit delta